MIQLKKTVCALASVLLALGLAGCSDLRDIEPDVCGNLAIDLAEDCDGSSPFTEESVCGAPGTSNACFLVCDADSEAICPEGWGCGTDGRCRRPSGNFVEGPNSPWRFPVESFGVGDVDGDGFADLIGNGTTTITVRFGDSIGSFDDELDVFTREPTGPLTFSDMNGDGLVDVLVPIASGLSTLLGTEERDLKPVAYSPFPVGTDTARIVPVPSDELINVASSLLLLDGSNDTLSFIEQGTVPLPGGNKVAQLAGRVPVGLVDIPLVLDVGISGGLAIQGGRHSFALAFEGATSVWVYSSTGDEDAGNMLPVLTHTIAMPAGFSVGPDGAHFADVNGDGTNDLLVHGVHQAQGDRIVVSLDNGTGPLQTLQATGQVIDFQDIAGQRVPFPLAVADLTGDGKADFVTGKGIFVTSVDVLVLPLGQVLFVTSSATTGAWGSGTVGDFNGDGFLDVASASKATDALFVYIGTGLGLFNPFIVPTEFPPSTLRAGDFDGDLVTDIAFVESDSELDADRVSVSFGASTGGTSAPVFMGELGSVTMLEPSLLPSQSGLDLVFDLLVLSAFDTSDGGTTLSLALLEGSSTRRMVAPFYLLAETGIVVPVRAVAGSFSEAGAVGDVVVVAVPGEDDTGEIGDSANLFLLEGRGNGQFDTNETKVLALTDAGDFDIGCAHWTVGDLDLNSSSALAPGLDELVGFDGGVGCRSTDNSYASPLLAIAESDQAGGVSFEISETGEDQFRAVADVDLFDADLDGDLDMVVLFRGEFSGGAGGNEPNGDGVVVYWHEDGQMVGWSSLDGADKSVRSVAPILLKGDDGVPELVVLGRDALYVSKLDSETGVFSDLEVLRENTAIYERFEVGDLNGDGLTDLALTFGDKVQVLLSEPAQTRGQDLADEKKDGSEPEPEPLPPAGGDGQ